jgi:hemoglobin
MSAETPTPSLYEWAGGSEAFHRLTSLFYDRVTDDAVLAPVFAGIDPAHPAHVADWLIEVFGGPASYTDEHGGYAHMLGKHIGLSITPEQRRRWVGLMSEVADEAGLPDDPEFRSAFVAYLEWGTRLALQNSQPGATPPSAAPTPRWGWGEAPPYRG